MAALDIVVVAYRSEADLPDLLEGVKTITALRHELYLFDNIGNPKTLTIAWNDLARQGSSDYIAFLNTDIRLSPSWDLRAVEGLCRHDTGAVIGNPVGHDWSNVAFADGKVHPDPPLAPAPNVEAMSSIVKKWRGRLDDVTYRGCNAPFFAAVIRRDMWEALLGFDERFRFYGQDHDFQRRMSGRFGKHTVRIASCAIWHRGAGSTRQALLNGDVNFAAEMAHCGKLFAQRASGEAKPWDHLSDEERAAVRLDPVYSKMPR